MSHTPHAEAGQQQDVDLGIEQRRYVGAEAPYGPHASHRGAPGSRPRLEPETNRYARVHSQIDCWVDTVTTNLYPSPGTHVALSVAFRTTKPGLITSWRTDKSDHVVGNSVQHRSAPAV